MEVFNNNYLLEQFMISLNLIYKKNAVNKINQ